MIQSCTTHLLYLWPGREIQVAVRRAAKFCMCRNLLLATHEDEVLYSSDCGHWGIVLAGSQSVSKFGLGSTKNIGKC